MTITVTLLGTGSPLPDPNRAGPSTPRPGRRRQPPRRRRPRLRDAPRGRRPVPQHGHWRAADPPAQRPHLRPERRDHLALGHQPGADRAADPRAGRHRRRRRRHRADAATRRRLPPRPPRRPHRGAGPRRGRARPRRDLRVGGLHGVSTHATDHRPVEPTLGFRIEHDGHRRGDRRRHRALPRPRRAVRRRRPVRADRDPGATSSPWCPNARLQDILDYHSTVEQAAQTAARAGVGHPGADPLRAAVAARPGGRVASDRRRRTSAGRSSWATT